jgi:hypothetical protein
MVAVNLFVPGRSPDIFYRPFRKSRKTYHSGAVAQLGERDVRNVEARGSIPLSSTFFRISVRNIYVFSVDVADLEILTQFALQ